MINASFRKLWTGDLISQFGDRVTELALPLIAVATLAATPAQVGLLTAAVWVPNLLGVLAGAWVDRRPCRRSIMIGADLLRAAALASLPTAHWLGMITLSQLFVVAVLAGVGQVLSMAAYQSFFVTLVPPERYVDAKIRHPYLRSALACVTTLNFFTFIAQALLVLFASRTLGLPAGVIGLALGFGAAGGLLGAAFAPRLAIRYGVGRLIVVGSILFPAPIAMVALATGPHWLAAAIIAAAEALSATGVMIFDINLNAVQTAVTADHMRSRVSGVFSTINYGSRPLGALIGGLLGSWIGVRPTLLLAAAGGTLCCLWLLPSPISRIHALSDVGPAAELVSQ